MVHDGKVICESFVLLEYIDETWKHHPLLPHDPYDRAIARFWACFVEEKILENAWIAMCSEGEEKEKATKIAIDAVERIEELLKGKQFFGGDDIGYLDLAVGWVSHWLPVWDEVGSTKILDPLRFPSTTSWATNFLGHPLIRDNLPPKDKMLDYFHQKKGRIMASRARV
ncbi:hypothetical protein CRG98_014375 [Punica granatum]|nr:hypothetical protein CRG98_014375 [Punica granatum]